MLKYYVVLGISILFNCGSLILMKLAARGSDDVMNNLSSPAAWLKLVTNGYMVAAVVCFGCSFVTWMVALKKIDLSLAYPLVSVSYILIALASHWLFNEHLTTYRWLGMGLIIGGVIVMFQK